MLTYGKSVWRPLKHPVEDRPLAVCDGSTVDPTRLIVSDHIKRRYTGSTIHPLYSPDYRWYYLKGQDCNEVLILKNFDSEQNVMARCKNLH